ncbi:hypothetical protein AHAS_Ahas09G0161600 [Arachis hypogaea]
MEDVHDEEVHKAVKMDEDKKDNVVKEKEEQLKPKEPKRENILEGPTLIPFPTIAKKAKKHEELELNKVQIFKKVEVTIPLFYAIHQVPKYDKFLKDVCTHKEKIGELEMNPFGARFVLADKSIVSVVDIAENILVNIQDLTFLMDFHISGTPPIDSDRPSSVLLGRPFLKTSQFELDAFSRAYSFEAEGKIKDIVEVHPRRNKEVSVNKNLSMGGVNKEDEGAPPFPNHQEDKESTLLLKGTHAKHNKKLEVSSLEMPQKTIIEVMPVQLKDVKEKC